MKVKRVFELTPGDSLTITQDDFINFGHLKSIARLLRGELSHVNDYKTENYYYDKVWIFSEIKEMKNHYIFYFLIMKNF